MIKNMPKYAIYSYITCWSPNKPPIKNLVWRSLLPAHTMSRVRPVFSTQSPKNAFQHSWYKRYFLAALHSYPLPGRRPFVFLSSKIGNHPTGIQFSGFWRSSSWIFKSVTANKKLKIRWISWNLFKKYAKVLEITQVYACICRNIPSI